MKVFALPTAELISAWKYGLKAGSQYDTGPCIVFDATECNALKQRLDLISTSVLLIFL